MRFSSFHLICCHQSVNSSTSIESHEFLFRVQLSQVDSIISNVEAKHVSEFSQGKTNNTKHVGGRHTHTDTHIPILTKWQWRQ